MSKINRYNLFSHNFVIRL